MLTNPNTTNIATINPIAAPPYSEDVPTPSEYAYSRRSVTRKFREKTAPSLDNLNDG